MQSLNELKRLGLYKLPRSVLLPPYLLLTPYFKEYSDAVDHVFGSSVDEKTHVLQNIRNMWVTNPELERDVLDHLLINFDKWSAPERALVVQQVNMLGMKLKSSGALTNADYLRISRFLGQYWYEKGTYSFIEFINFCANADLKVFKMWSQRPKSKVTRRVRLQSEHDVAITGFLRFKGITLGTFSNSPANSLLNVSWLNTEYTPTGTNTLEILEDITQEDWKATPLEIHVTSPFAEVTTVRPFE